MEARVAHEAPVMPHHQVAAPLLESQRAAQASVVSVIVTGPVREKFWERFRDVSRRILADSLPWCVIHIRRVHSGVPAPFGL